MKKRVLKATFIALFTCAGGSLFASNPTEIDKSILVNDSTVETFKVYGNCGMCKRTIEGSLKDQEGIFSADWDTETKMMVVNYNESLISLEDIKKKITSVGYDTEEHRATDESYKGLHGCCQYERPEKK